MSLSISMDSPHELPLRSGFMGHAFAISPVFEPQRSKVTGFLSLFSSFYFRSGKKQRALTPARTWVQQLCGGAAAPAVLHRCCFKLQRPVRPHSQKRLTHAENYHRPSRTIHTQTHTYAGLCLPFTRFPHYWRWSKSKGARRCRLGGIKSESSAMR